MTCIYKIFDNYFYKKQTDNVPISKITWFFMWAANYSKNDDRCYRLELNKKMYLNNMDRKLKHKYMKKKWLYTL